MTYVLTAPKTTTLRERARVLVTGHAPLSEADECAVAEWHEKRMHYDRSLAERAADVFETAADAPVVRRRPTGRNRVQ